MAGDASVCVANRRALLFVYYSTTKKTVSRLTKRVHDAMSVRVDIAARIQHRTTLHLPMHTMTEDARIADVA
jgi:hypothetical protein